MRQTKLQYKNCVMNYLYPHKLIVFFAGKCFTTKPEEITCIETTTSSLDTSTETSMADQQTSKRKNLS